MYVVIAIVALTFFGYYLVIHIDNKFRKHASFICCFAGVLPID